MQFTFALSIEAFVVVNLIIFLSDWLYETEHYSDAKAAIKDLSLNSPKNGVKPLSVPAKYREKPLQCVSPKYSPRRIIHQPR